MSKSMKLRFDFFSRDEYSILLDGVSPPFDENESELLIFSCFTLRQLHNLGRQIGGFVLSGLLVFDENITEFLISSAKLPSTYVLLNSVSKHASFEGISSDPMENYKEAVKINEELNFNSTFVRIFDEDILSKFPKRIDKGTTSKKYFEATYPPFFMSVKGFSFFGNEVNFYSFHSVTGLIRFLGQKHSNNRKYLNKLNKAAKLCARAHIFKKTTAIQDKLAIEIMSELA